MWIRPIDSLVVTSPFGQRGNEFHNGIDLRAEIGTPVIAPEDGNVLGIFSNAAGGNQLTIKHDNGWTTGYAHLMSYNVHQGDRVKQGKVIAHTGATGNVTGPHLHFVMRDPAGNLVDPETIMKNAGSKPNKILRIVLFIALYIFVQLMFLVLYLVYKNSQTPAYAR